jgi:hypothetical protein
LTLQSFSASSVNALCSDRTAEWVRRVGDGRAKESPFKTVVFFGLFANHPD